MPYLFEVEIHVARARILYSLGAFRDAETELQHAEDLCIDVAGSHGYRGIKLPETIRPSPEIADLWDYFYAEAASWAEDEARDYARLIQQEGNREPAMVYCPSGHNAVFSQHGYDECAACGAVMTAAAEESYFDSLCSAGQCM